MEGQMADILDYIVDQGDKKFEVLPFNEVDSLILIQLSYFDFEGIVEWQSKSYRNVF